MRLTDFDYDLPDDLIAQEPLNPRDTSKLMILDRQQNQITHHYFRDVVDFVQPHDVLVFNTTRVIPARLKALRADTGGRLELLLLKQLSRTQWQVLIGGQRGDMGMSIKFNGVPLAAKVVDVLDQAERVVEFNEPIGEYLKQIGEMPLPPYIHTQLSDTERYQTIYSQHEGSAAAPTAGLHFTPELLGALHKKNVKFAYCTLHIGLDTFQPVRVDDIRDHRIHSEWATLTADDAKIINQAKLRGGRIIVVGTTTARTLETAGILSAGGNPAKPHRGDHVCHWRPVIGFEGDTRLFIYPGYRWRIVDGMITNFHLPKSTLLMMISAFAGHKFVLEAYEMAKREHYRFFSFGDAMLIL